MTIGGMLRLGVGGAGAAAYSDKVLGYSPIAYWPLWEASGGVAECLVNSVQNGAATGVTWGQPGIGDGRTSAFFDGGTDFVNVFTPTFRDAFNNAAGSVLIWAKVFNAAVWDDTSWDFLFRFRASDGNYVSIARPGQANRLGFQYVAGGTYSAINKDSMTAADWMVLGLTWDKLANEVKAFYGGSQEGSTQTGLGTWVGALGSIKTIIGGNDTTPVFPFLGWLAHCAVWDSAQTPAVMADLAVV